jgi:hypothetical protein
MREAERELAQQAERAHERTVADWQAKAPPKKGASATPRRASSRPLGGNQRGKAQPQTPRTSSSSLAPGRTLPKEAAADKSP